MVAALALVLCGCLALVPLVVEEVPQVEVCGFGHEGTSTYCSIRSVTIFWLIVPFVEDEAQNKVKLLKCCVVNVTNDGIEEKIEMGEALLPSVKVV